MPESDTFVRIAPVGRADGVRGVRAFVSSTFGDMQSERDALIKVAFPEVAKRCAERDVEFSSVELRWGITDEQVEGGRVLSICLGEIERCRPYFIGLLGDYYGSLPNTIPPELIREYPWLTEGASRSVTEIEMLAILRDPERAERALFFIRNSGATSLPHNPERAWTSTGEAAQKLVRLKKEIADSGLPIAQFCSPEDLATQVRDLLWKSIEQEFPPVESISGRDREASLHRIHAAQHARVYVGTRSTLARLSMHLRGEGPPLVITGPAGIGKTALVAAWLTECEQDLIGTPMVLHCAGATPYAHQWASMLRRIVRDLSELVRVADDAQDKEPNELLLSLPGFLREVANKSRVLLIVDGADQIRGPSGNADWGWIPLELPPQVRVVVTTRDGSALKEMESRGWSVLAIQPLGEDQQRALIDAYLSRVGRSLDEADLKRILSSPLAKHPLFLRVLLRELLTVGSYAELSAQIASYLRSESVSDLYVKVFHRWESDFGSNVVRKSLALIAVCSYGISEQDLRMMVSPRNTPLESAEWSPFLLSAELELSPRPGFLALTNEHIATALVHDYLRDEDECAAREQAAKLYRSIVSTFVGFTFVGGVEKRIPTLKAIVNEAARSLSDMKERAFSELPRQLISLHQWDALLDILKSHEYLDWAFEHAGAELNHYWRQLSMNRPGSALVLCDHVDLSTPSGVRRSHRIAGLQAAIGESEGALKMFGGLSEMYRREKNWSPLGHTLLKRASVFRQRRDFFRALDDLREAEALFRASEDEPGYAIALADQGVTLYLLGDDDKAIQKLEAAMRLLQKAGLPVPLAFVYNGLGSLLSKRGLAGRGLELLRRAETIFREIGNLEELSRTLNNQALALAAAGRLRDATKCRQDAARISKDIGSIPSVAVNDGKPAGILRRWLKKGLHPKG